MQLPWERKRRPARRRVVKTVEQKEREHELRTRQEAIRTLRETAPAEYRQILIDRARAELGVSRRPNRASGKDEQSGGMLDSIFNSEFAAGLGQGLAAMLGGMAGGGGRPPFGGGVVVPSLPAASPPPPAPAAAAEESAPPEPAAAAPTPTATPPAPGPLSMESRWLIGQLSGKTPEERARWLLALDYPLARELTGHLLVCTDAQLPQLWGAVVASNPATAGLIAWLTAQPDYLATVAEVRRQGAAAAANGAPVH